MPGRPEGLPELFLDRSLGRRQVPSCSARRACGCARSPRSTAYPPTKTIPDVDWLARAGREGCGWC